MKTQLLKALVVVIMLLLPTLNFAQAPPLGTAANFVLFTTVGAVGNTGISQVTGNVGTNSGSITGFGNVNGVMCAASSGQSAQCATDLLIAYNHLNSLLPNFFPAPLLGNGQVLIAGVYSISGAATLNLDLILDAQGSANAVFIFLIQGPFSTGANSKIKLINGALACNVFWKVEGLVSMAAGTTMRGTVIANNAAINMSAGDTLEGRALSTTGAVNVLGVLAYTPIGCGSPDLSGPIAPILASTQCYTLFSSNGPVSNAGITHVTDDVGTNVGLTPGFDPLFVTGAIHPIPDGSTAQCAADLDATYTFLNVMPIDIELLYPAQFGHNLVLTPHAYLMNAATTFTDTLYLNALGNANAVFVIKINGALSTSTYAKVVLINGAQAKNIYWKVDGAVSINDNSVFCGTIVCNNGAILLNTGVSLEGRAFSTTGALSTTAITANMPAGCGGSNSPVITAQPVNQTICNGGPISFSVAATGTGLTYQWRKGSLNIANGGNISGASTETLSINPVNVADAATNYNVFITGTFSPTVTSMSVSLTLNPTPVPTIGSTNNPCMGSTNNMYYTESGMTGYAWTTSSGGTIVSGQGTSTLNVTWTQLGAQTVSVNYLNAAGCMAALPSVYTIFVNSPPNAAGAITGTSSICAGTNGVTYSTTSIVGITSYAWTVPAGATLVTGSGTTSITVDFGATAVTGTVTVAGTNQCGNGPASTIAVTVNPVPETAGIISGSVSVCTGATGVAYSVSTIADATAYVWTVPAGATIITGALTKNIVVAFGQYAGTGVITVKGTNNCGPGTVSPGLNVIIHDIPANPVVTVTGNVLTSSSIIDNQWYYNNTLLPGATNQTYTVTNNTGNYWCVVTLDGCASGISNKIWYEVVGTPEYPVSSSFNIYPVPNDGQFTASFSSPVDEVFTITVYNQLGDKLFDLRDLKTVGGKFETQIDLRPAPNGMYLIVFKNSQFKVIKKFYVNQ
ncbi:MAG: ice-binding family protein [Bacteroidota bacterium]